MSLPPDAPRASRAALSRDLADFLLEFSIALHKHAMYPEGHPSLGPAADAVVRRAVLLLADRPSISLGVARHQLVIEGVATDARHPVLRDLADRLHRHHLGAVTFRRGVNTDEVASVFRTLAVEAERTGAPIGLGPRQQLSAWPHVRLHPVTFDRLELVEADPPEVREKPAEHRAAQLWLGLARTALAAGGPADEPPPSTEPVAVAQAINAPPRTEGYDQAIVGYLLQIAQELKTAGGSEAAALRRRMSRLIAALEPDTLRRLVDMGGDAAQRRQFALDVSQSLAADSVLDIVRAAGEVSGESVSHALVRMLSKLAVHAEQGSAGRRAQADTALREQVRDLIAGWTLDDPNPAAYGEALRGMAQAAPPHRQTQSAPEPAEPERLLQMALELGEVRRPVWHALARLVEHGRVAAVCDLLDGAPAPPPTSGVAELLWERLTVPEVVRGLLTREPADFPTLDRLVSRLERPALEAMLDILSASESRATRRGLLARLRTVAGGIADVIAARAADGRWYVQRNMLILLDALPALPEGFSAAPHLVHPDPRVRREALKVSVRIPGERDHALVVGLGDADERTVSIALTIAQQECPASAVSAIVRLATDPTGPSERRLIAIRVLGGLRAPPACAALLQMTDGGRTILRRRRLPPKSLELLAALAALAAGWRRDPRARAVLGLAASSKDPDIRRAAHPSEAS